MNHISIKIMDFRILILICFLVVFFWSFAGNQTISIAPKSISLHKIEIHATSDGLHNFQMNIGPGISQTITAEAWLLDSSGYSSTYDLSLDGKVWGNSISWQSDSGGENDTIFLRCSPTEDIEYHKLARIVIYDESFSNFDEITASISLTLPEIKIEGNALTIFNGDSTPCSGDNTDFGIIESGFFADKIFTIANTKAAFPPNNGGRLFLNGSENHIEIKGPHAADFSVSHAPSSPIEALADPINFTIRFKPNGSGVRQAIISIPNNSPNNNPYTFFIKGIGVAPEIDIIGNNNSIKDNDYHPSKIDSTDFGSLDVRVDSCVHTFWIHNTGKANLYLQDHNPGKSEYVWIDGQHSSDFFVSRQPGSIISKKDCSKFRIQFKPTSIGIRTATIHIDNNDINEGNYDFEIRGHGIEIEP